jgi:outer membrane protein assembly factor BamA
MTDISALQEMAGRRAHGGRRLQFATLVLLASCGAWVRPAEAQEATPVKTLAVLPEIVGAEEQDLTVGAPAQVPAEATLDLGDLWRRLWRRPAPAALDPAISARKSAFVLAPVIGSKPSTGLSLGVASNITFFRGDPQTTHISTGYGALRFTQEHQLLSSLRFAVFTDHDRWFLQGDNRFQLNSLNTYDLGTDAPATGAVNTKYHYSRVFEAAFLQVAKRLFVGAGVDADLHSNVAPASTTTQSSFDQSAFVTYSNSHQLPLASQASGGTTFNVLFDNRDSSVNPRHGWLASASYRTFFKGFLRGDSTWQELYLDTRTYVRLTSSGRHTLAFWGIADLVTGGTAPFLDLPDIGSDGRSGRGYSEGRFRGDHLAYGEVEYRGTLSPNGLFGMVAFLNTVTVSNSVSHEQLGDSFATGAGLGLRVLLNKRSRTNLCADYGWGKQGSRGFYLTIQEAF